MLRRPYFLSKHKLIYIAYSLVVVMVVVFVRADYVRDDFKPKGGWVSFSGDMSKET